MRTNRPGEVLENIYNAEPTKQMRAKRFVTGSVVSVSGGEAEVDVGYYQPDGTPQNYILPAASGFNPDAGQMVVIGYASDSPHSGVVMGAGGAAIVQPSVGDHDLLEHIDATVATPVKGDVIAFATKWQRLAVGANNLVFMADSAQAAGVKWAQVDHGNLAGLGDDDHTIYTLRSILTTKGDLFVYNGSAIVRVGVGSNDQVLTADSAQAAGVKWAAGGSALPTICYIAGAALTDNVLANLSDGTNWNTNKAIINAIIIATSATNWDLYLYSDADGSSGVFASMQVVANANGNKSTLVPISYVDNDVAGQVHVKFVDNAAANGATITILGQKAT